MSGWGGYPGNETMGSFPVTKVAAKPVSPRRPDLGAIADLPATFGAAWATAMWRRAAFARAFDLEAGRAVKDKRVTCPVYLGVGQEFIAAALSLECGDWPLFAQHRAHAHFLCRGGCPESLRDSLLSGPLGSASIHDDGKFFSVCSAHQKRDPTCSTCRCGVWMPAPMYGHSGLMGDQIPIACGYAFATGERTLAVMGDASAEEDYVGAALGEAASKKLPVLFVVEDNDLSILTRTAVRRSWSIVDLARAYGLHAVDIADDPWLIAHHARDCATRLPALLNVRTCRHLWHAGYGCDGVPEWDRRELVSRELTLLGVPWVIPEVEETTRAARVWSEEPIVVEAP